MKKIKIWTSCTKTVTPIDESQIPNFKEWVWYQGFRKSSTPFRRDGHEAFDFSAYLNTEGNCIVGLPEGTIVRAVRGGTVTQANLNDFRYSSFVNIEHGARNNGTWSGSVHVTPLVEDGQKVEIEQPIAKLYYQRAESGGAEQLIHLHFALTNYYSLNNVSVDPEKILFNRRLPRFKDYPDRVIIIQKGLDREVFLHPERL